MSAFCMWRLCIHIIVKGSEIKVQYTKLHCKGLPLFRRTEHNPCTWIRGVWRKLWICINVDWRFLSFTTALLYVTIALLQCFVYTEAAMHTVIPRTKMYDCYWTKSRHLQFLSVSHCCPAASDNFWYWIRMYSISSFVNTCCCLLYTSDAADE